MSSEKYCFLILLLPKTRIKHNSKKLINKEVSHSRNTSLFLYIGLLLNRQSHFFIIGSFATATAAHTVMIISGIM